MVVVEINGDIKPQVSQILFDCSLITLQFVHFQYSRSGTCLSANKLTFCGDVGTSPEVLSIVPGDRCRSEDRPIMFHISNIPVLAGTCGRLLVDRSDMDPGNVDRKFITLCLGSRYSPSLAVLELELLEDSCVGNLLTTGLGVEWSVLQQPGFSHIFDVLEFMRPHPLHNQPPVITLPIGRLQFATRHFTRVAGLSALHTIHFQGALTGLDMISDIILMCRIIAHYVYRDHTTIYIGTLFIT